VTNYSMPTQTIRTKATTPPALRLVHPQRDPDEVRQWRLEAWLARPWTPPSNRPYPVSTDE